MNTQTNTNHTVCSTSRSMKGDGTAKASTWPLTSLDRRSLNFYQS